MKGSSVFRVAARALRTSLEEEFSRDVNHLLPYNAPKWASKLKRIPTDYVELASTPTPIQDWQLKNVASDFTLSIKRDDLTGHLVSGNKIRKLEFLFADAVAKDSTCIITCGGRQSNHCRTTAIAAKQLGLGCHLLFKNHDQEEDSKPLSANMLLCKMHGAESYSIPSNTVNGRLEARLHKLAQELKKQGERPYIISLGGSDYLGTFGIINSFTELMNQDVLSNYDDIVVAANSGGTLAGLAVANYLTGEKLSVHGMSLCNNTDYFYNYVQDTLQTFGVRANALSICNIIEAYNGEGNVKTTQKDLENIGSICQESGILLDNSNTLKAVNQLLIEMKTNPKRFKGNRILFIHTGGTFNVFDGLLENANSVTSDSTTHVWRNIEDSPFNS